MTDHTLGWAGRYRTRMTLGYVLVVALLAVVWGWSLYGPLTDAVIDQQQRHLQSVAQAGTLVVSEHPSDLEPAVRRLVAGTGLRMTVIAADGEVLADSSEDPRSMANHANRPEVAEALAGRVGHDVRLSATQNIEQTYVAVPARIGDQRAVVRVSESLASISELSASARRTGLAILIAGVAAALLIGGWIARSTARPVEQLADAACAMAAGDLTSPIPVGSGPLEPLASALKQLREQMRERIDALESERKSLRSVVDGLQDAVLLLEDDVITLHNRAAVLLLRSRPAELQGRRLADTPLSASLVAAIKSALAEGGTVLRDLAQHPLQRSLRLAVVPLGMSGDRSRTLVIVSDITERAVLDSMRRDFVTNASHELKTPTAGILLLAQSAAQAAADGDKDRALGFLTQIEHEAQRLRQLVLDLLDLSRFEGPAERDEVTDVRQAIELSVSAHRRSATEKGLSLTVDVSRVEGSDVFARADRTDVAIALDNALANAIGYTEHGSVMITLDADSDSVRIAVRDTGIGIPAEHLSRVFERFYRVDRARSRSSGGTGLGLSLVKHAVERSGGSVAIISEEGRGTTLTMQLPRAV